jgi:hypothetical protein
MTTIHFAAVSALAIMIATPALAASDTDNKNCKIVERDASKSPDDGTLSSSVTAGGGKVSAHSSGGNSVTMHSGNGSVSSSVTTTGSGGRGQTVVTNSDGSCTIYRDKEK